MNKDLDRDYDHHPPQTKDDEIDHAMVREAFKQTAKVIQGLAPNGSRETALAHTHLETAMFWANAAIARQRYDQKQNQTEA